MGKLSAPIQELYDRLDYQAQAGRILEGYKVSKVPITEADNVDDFPCVNFQSLEITDDSQENEASFSSVVVTLEVGVAKGSSLIEIVAAAEKVMDALEYDSAGVLNRDIGNTTVRSIKTKAQPSTITGSGIYLGIAVTLETVPYARGGRRNS